MVALIVELVRIGLIVFVVSLVWRFLFRGAEKNKAQQKKNKGSTQRFDGHGKRISDADFHDVPK